MRRWGEIIPLSAFLSGEGHLASIVTQKSDDGGEEKHHDKIDWIRNFLTRTPPDDEDDFEDEEKN
jgi:hypothetical protein